MLSAQQSMKNAAFEVKEKLNKNKENLVDQVIYCNASFDVCGKKDGIHQKMVLSRQYQKIMEEF